MDEITMYAALQPADGNEPSLDAARQRLAREIAAPARPRPRRRVLLAAGAIAAAAAAAIAIVQVGGPGRNTSQFVTGRGWSSTTPTAPSRSP
jgi:ferric-dicitrate binding protein FerR (iron transport regulator)